MQDYLTNLYNMESIIKWQTGTPDKDGEFWCDAPEMRISNNSFPEITIENSPQKFKLELVKE